MIPMIGFTLPNIYKCFQVKTNRFYSFNYTRKQRYREGGGRREEGGGRREDSLVFHGCCLSPFCAI
jgi:hypothetical protein